MPDPRSSLLDVYGLRSIADSVARNDPVTGIKRKLRKSYKGKITDLSGRNEIEPIAKVAAIFDDNPEEHLRVYKGSFIELLQMPEDDYYSQKVHGKEMPKPGKAIGRPLDLEKLRKGLSGWSKGPIPDVCISVTSSLLLLIARVSSVFVMNTPLTSFQVQCHTSRTRRASACCN